MRLVGFLVLAAVAMAQERVPQPDYRGYVLQSLPEPVAFRHKPGARYGADYARAAAVHAWAWQWTGRREYAQTALDIVRAMSENWAPGDDFFALHPFLTAYQKVDQGGLVDDTLRQRVRAVVLEKFKPGQRGNHNQMACRIAGVALAVKLFPDLPEAKAWSAYVDAGWQDWYAIRDTIENAPNYNRIFWEMMFQVADLTGRNALLLDRRVKHVFERYRDQVTPGGVIPGVGDSAVQHRDSNWISTFERAATLYQDATLRWAAVQMTPLPAADPQAVRRNVRAIGDLLSFCYAEQWRDHKLGVRMPNSRTAVLTRATETNPNEPTQIVLAASRNSGAPYVMIELFAQQGGHAHPEWGALQYFEIDNVPLLHGPGYNNRNLPHANIVLISNPGEPFPHRDVPFKANVWYEASFPLQRLWPMHKPPTPVNHAAALKDLERKVPSGADMNLRHFDTFIFRVENGGQQPNNSPPIDVWVDNLRLVGRAGEKRLDDFEAGAPERWRGGLKRELSPDAKQGEMSLRASCAGGPTFLSREFDLTYKASDYQYIKFDWKLSSDRSARVRPFIVRLIDRGRDYSADIVYPPVPAVVRDAKASMLGDTSYGETTIEPYITEGTRLRRQSWLTREGVLIVRDTVTPGKAAEGQICGPIWHLWSKPQSGANWFDAAGEAQYGADKKRLLIYMLEAKDRSFGVQDVTLAASVHPFTAYARQTLHAGKALSYVTVLIPHSTSVSAAELAAAIRVTADSVTVTHPSLKVKLSLP